MQNYYDFGVIRTLRKKKQLTIAQLAELCCLTFPTLSCIETNKTFPSLASLHQIAEALGISVTSLLFLCKKTHVVKTAAERIQLTNGPKECVQDFMAASHGDIKVYRIPGQEGMMTNRQWNHGDVFEVNYILAGKVEVTVNDRTFTAETNETLFYDGLVPHAHKFLSAGEILIIHIPKNSFSLHAFLE